MKVTVIHSVENGLIVAGKYSQSFCGFWCGHCKYLCHNGPYDANITTDVTESGSDSFFTNPKSDGFSDSFTSDRIRIQLLFWKAFFHHSLQSAINHTKVNK